jgi:hypothetical protein
MVDTSNMPGMSAQFDTQAVQAFKEALKRSRKPDGRRTGTTPMNAPLTELRALVKRPSVQEYIAAEAAKAAQEADRTGKVELADLLWRFVRRTRVSAMKLRLLAEALRQGEGCVRQNTAMG